MINMDYKFMQLTAMDPELIAQIIAIEQDAFGIGGMNSWFLPPFIRHGRVYIILDQNRVVAVAEYMRDFNDPRHAYLFGFAVKKPYRNQGIGTALLKQSLRCLAQDGFARVSLTVDPHNAAAIKLYTNLGFKKREFLPNEYGIGEDRYVLTLVLADLKEVHNG
ncbi:MAG: GNAT family N-acetyltransferase [Firmicutes bacterium]|nr:GNAT family N-acetyltransferase [Bacillota bacterium]